MGFGCVDQDYCTLTEEAFGKGEPVWITGLEKIFDLLVERSEKSLKLHRLRPNRKRREREVGIVLTEKLEQC